MILKSPFLLDLSMQTLSSYCLVPMIRNYVLLSFSCYRSVAPCIAIIILGNCKRLKKNTLAGHGCLKCQKTIYSRLSLNGHLYKTDTSVKRTPRVGIAFIYSLYLTLYKTDISLRRTLDAGPKGVRFRES